MTTYLPGFRATCGAVAATYVLLAGSILVRGPMVAMADYAVPTSTLASPHYADAMTWVFLHMLFIGLLVGLFGWFVEGGRAQRAFARVMLGASLAYLFLDVRAADWAPGIGLYKGPQSLGPVVVGVVTVVAWLRLNVVRERTATK
jgi:hypothetical protein